jgi:hypothetical protein
MGAENTSQGSSHAEQLERHLKQVLDAMERRRGPARQRQRGQPKSQCADHHLATDGKCRFGIVCVPQRPESGFSWNSAPPAGVFGTPSLSNNGNQLSITDTNNSANTAGTWTYTLRITVDGTVYSSKTLSLAATDTNPWIKNK